MLCAKQGSLCSVATFAFAGTELGLLQGPDGPFESLGVREEAFYRSFSAKTQDLHKRWIDAAIREPYMAARAYLQGDYHYLLEELREILGLVNEQSYREFVSASAAALG